MQAQIKTFDAKFSSILSLFQCKVDKLVFIDVAESSTKGGSTDLEIFSLPNVVVSRGMSHSALAHSVKSLIDGLSLEVIQTNK